MVWCALNMFVLTAYWNSLALPCVHFLSGEHKKAHNNIYFTMHAKRRFMIRQPYRTRKHQNIANVLKATCKKKNTRKKKILWRKTNKNQKKKYENHNVIFVSLRREAYLYYAMKNLLIFFRCCYCCCFDEASCTRKRIARWLLTVNKKEKKKTTTNQQTIVADLDLVSVCRAHTILSTASQLHYRIDMNWIKMALDNRTQIKFNNNKLARHSMRC